MKLHAALIVSLLAPAFATPLPDSDNPAAVLVKRDKWCRVSTVDGAVACRRGPGTTHSVVRRIGARDRFGVDCKKVVGGK